MASVLPAGTDFDELLRLMKIGPKEGAESGISEYVESKKATEDDREGTLGDHYGYPRPFTQSPNSTEVRELHKKLRELWDGELPTVFDPTAGGGVIPFESLRYGLPTYANELNPIPSLILKVMLEYAPQTGSLQRDLNKWTSRIDEIATERLEEYFPSGSPGQRPSHYACTYSIDCPECGCDIPLVKKWWLRKRSSSNGVAVRPKVSDDENTIEYACVELPADVSKGQFNPQNGPHSRGGAECINCGVVTESKVIRDRIQSDEYEYELYGVKYVKESGGSGFRAPTKEDESALIAAAERIDSDFEIHNLLTTERYIGDEDRAGPYGVTRWRDAYSPRQLISHYEYLRAYEEVKPEIQSDHDENSSDTVVR